MGPLLTLGLWIVGLWASGKVLERLERAAGGPRTPPYSPSDGPPADSEVSLVPKLVGFDPGIADWVSWAEGPATAPAEKGVYVVRTLRRAPESVVYIGKAANLGGIRQRLMQYRSPGYSNSTSIRIRDLCKQDPFVEVGWIVDSDPARLEAELLAKFRQANGELPLWNKQHARLRADPD